MSGDIKKHKDILPLEDFLAEIKRYRPNANESLITRAYLFGLTAHKDQFRKSGEPYFIHPIEVALWLSRNKLDDSTIVTALLHDTIEDVDGVDYKKIQREFSREIADLVEGVTKLTQLNLPNTPDSDAENLRKLLLATSKDARVLLVKLADRWHNMHTISHMSPDKQRKKSEETMDIYAPLAGRFGMQSMREELEDLAFKVLHPMARGSILKKVARLRGDSVNLLDEILTTLRETIQAAHILADVTGREKRPYSIWKKIQSKHEGFERLSDIYAFRVITDRVEDCYLALGAIHQRWSAIPGKFKDYISQPKPNGYRSIHTAVTGEGGKRIEIQIRTQEMHVVAESGVAAHWAYKEGQVSKNPYLIELKDWYENIINRLGDNDDEEFLENFKLDIHTDVVFLFTPKGRVIEIQRGSTPIDFAYAIHTDLGDHIVGAYVDGKPVPLHTVLRNGQTINIVKADAAKPHETWLSFVKTGRARAAIKRSLREEHKSKNMEWGRDILDVAFQNIDKTMTNKILDTAAKLLEFRHKEAMLDALGRNELEPLEVLTALYPELDIQEEITNTATAMPPLSGKRPLFSAQPATCCMPVAGDHIMGIMKKGEGIVYHRSNCSRLAEYENDESYHWISLKWPDELRGAAYKTLVLVVMQNDPGVLGQVCTSLGRNHANIEQIEFLKKHNDSFRVLFEISVRNVEHLYNIIRALEIENRVLQVKRYRRTDIVL